MSINSRFNGTLAIVFASLLWGTTGTVAHFASNVSPLAIGAFAMGFGGIFLCANAAKSLVHDLSKMRKMPVILVAGSICVAVYPLAFYTSMRWSGVTIGTLVSIASAPLFSVILERLFCQKPFSWKWGVSFVLGAGGVLLLSSGKTSREVIEMDTHLQQIGVCLGLVAGLTYAGYSLAVKSMINSGVNSRSAMAGLFGLAALILLPSLFVTGENLFVSAGNTIVALYMAIIPMFFGYLLYGYGLRSIDASKATLITLIEPLIAALLAVWILDETFRPIGWLGMMLVCACLLIQSVKIESRASS